MAAKMRRFIDLLAKNGAVVSCFSCFFQRNLFPPFLTFCKIHASSIHIYFTGIFGAIFHKKQPLGRIWVMKVLECRKGLNSFCLEKQPKKTTQPRTFLTDFSRSSFTNRSGSRSVLRRHFSRDGEVLSWMMGSPGFCVVVCWIFCVEKWFVWVGPVAYNDPWWLIFTLCSMGDIFQHLPQRYFFRGNIPKYIPIMTMYNFISSLTKG